MHPNERIRFRAVERISDQLLAARSALSAPSLPESDWLAYQQLDRQFRRAQTLGWHRAAARLRQQGERALSELSAELQATCAAFHSAHHETSLPSLREIHLDLLALEQEYDQVAIDLSEQTLAVVTDRIVLEGVDLGPFQIRLHWDQMGEQPPYEVLALDPDPSRSDESTTHPHVRDGALCEGDGQGAIRRALRQGRILDFFAIVNGILGTYNSGSPYVPLSQWRGQPCASCDNVVGEGDDSSCAACGDLLCSECLVYCDRCDSVCCAHCAISCVDCELTNCKHCVCGCTENESTGENDLPSKDHLSEEPDDEPSLQPDDRKPTEPEAAEPAAPKSSSEAA